MKNDATPSGFWRAIFLPTLGAVLSALCAGGCTAPKNNPSHNVTIEVSPNGESLLFTGEGKRGADIFLLDLTTGTVQQITDTDTQELTPKFSADGKWIVFTRGKPGLGSNNGQFVHDRRIFVRELATKKETQITFAPVNVPASRTRTDYEPAFSADGRFVVFYGATPRNGSPFSYIGDIFCVEVASGRVRRLTQDNQNMAARPAFGEGDASIVYAVHKNEKEWEGTYLISLPFQAVPPKNALTPTLFTPKGANYYSARPMGKCRLILIGDPGRKWIWRLTIREANGTFTYLDDSTNGMSSPTYDKVNDRLFYLEGWNRLTCYDLKTKTKTIIAGQDFFDAPLKNKIDHLP